MADTNLRLNLEMARRTPAAVPDRGAATASVPNVPPGVIGGLTLLVAALCGRFLADGRIKYGAALVLATFFAPLVFFEFPGAVAVWTAVQFFKDIRALSVAPNTLGVLVGLGFLGIFFVRGNVRPILQRHRKLLIGIVLFMLWLTISAAWAPEPGTALNGAGYYWLAALAFLLVMTTLTRSRDIAIVALAFVLGATISAIIGLGSGSLSTAAAAAKTGGQLAANGRLTGGGGDPNLQAAGFIAAMFLAMGLLTVYRRRAARIGLLAGFTIITVGFFATQSRGGLIALGVSTIAALVLFPNQRRRLLGFVLLGLVIAGISVASNPSSLARITDLGGGTSGRSDIWAVATKVFEQHPLVGVGMSNFQVVEPRFALLHRALTRVSYIAEHPREFPAHNTYLGMLAETGIVGLLGFLAVIIACLRTTLLAARLFERKGMHDLAHLARATLMGAIAMLTAIFFFTDGEDWRLWILLGLGPALLAVAHHAPARTRMARPRRPAPAGL